MTEEITFIHGETDQQSIAILPGSAVSTFLLELPDLSDAKLNKIIPSVLVDRLAGDINDVHFSILERQENGQYLIAVCDEKWMHEAQKIARQNETDLIAIWPDYALIATPNEGINIVSKNGYTLGKRNNGTGFSVKEGFIEHVIGNNNTNSVTLNDTPPDGVGLASGKFSKRPPVLVFIKAVKRLAIISCLALISWIAYTLMLISDNEQARLEYADSAIELFKQTYPEETRIVNVETQMRTLIAASGGAGGTDFLTVADDLFKAINETSGISMEQLFFDGTGDVSEATVTIASTTFSQVTAFENHLSQNGYRIEQGGSSQSGDKIFSDYRIIGAVQ